MPSQPTKIFHIPGRVTLEAPNVDHEVESKAEAERLVATGAFALSQKDANAAAFSTPEATPATDENVKPRGLASAGKAIEPAPEPEPAPEAPAAEE